jgi:hypothetical protein
VAESADTLFRTPHSEFRIPKSDKAAERLMRWAAFFVAQRGIS